jgi:hypothetical protein
MTEPEAQEMLAKLSVHYREPVRRISEYCEAFEHWLRVIDESAACDEHSPWKNEEWVGHIDGIRLAVRKSCLLDRLIYDGQKLRQEKCPKHQGRWSGIDGGPSMPHSHCEHGCDLTGWLPEPEDLDRWHREMFAEIQAKFSGDALQAECERRRFTHWAIAHRPQWVAFYEEQISSKS